MGFPRDPSNVPTHSTCIATSMLASDLSSEMIHDERNYFVRVYYSTVIPFRRILMYHSYAITP